MNQRIALVQLMARSKQVVRGNLRARPIYYVNTQQSRYFYDTFGEFPATVPLMFLIIYLKTHHLDFDFYNDII